MKKQTLFLVGTFILIVWYYLAYMLYGLEPGHSDELRSEKTAKKVKKILVKLDKMVRQVKKQHEDSQFLLKSFNETEPVERIAVLMFACNRPSVKVSLDSLLKARYDEKKFPVFVSLGCKHDETQKTLASFGKAIKIIDNSNRGEPVVPANERKFAGYYKIAQNYKHGLNDVFIEHGHKQVIIVEDDLEFSPDFFEYFEATLPILRSDRSLWCVSAWNDNGKLNLIDSSQPELLHRSDFFGGLGWMMTRELWTTELSAKWPVSFWDDWMRLPKQRQNRSCIRPEIGRTKTFGKIGVSNGLFFDKHLKFIEVNKQMVHFKSENYDLSYLKKEKYDPIFEKRLKDAKVVDLDQVLRGPKSDQNVKVLYNTKKQFMRIAQKLGIMDDFKSGVPRMAYKGVVSTVFNNQRVLVAPVEFKGYDETW